MGYDRSTFLFAQVYPKAKTTISGRGKVSFMKISVFGLGYVGVVTCAILAQRHSVIGVDINPVKVEMINRGISPIIENGVAALLEGGIRKKSLEATLDNEYAVINSQVSILCVGTPADGSGQHDLTSLYNVFSQIAHALKRKKNYHLVVLRSTVPPGTTEHFRRLFFDGLDVGICFNPEFLREGSAVNDYLAPPFILAACDDQRAEHLIRELYDGISGELIMTSFQEAELTKIVRNIFHALKIVFANEVGRFCERFGIDGEKVMDLICLDRKLSISEKYLRPGFAYGGSCIPKDLGSFLTLARKNGMNLPLIEAIEVSNDRHLQMAIDKILACDKRKIGFIGLSFKKGTDDLRSSPYVKLVKTFVDRGFIVKVYDPSVHLASLLGVNKHVVETELPNLAEILCREIAEVMDSEVIVLNHDLAVDHYLQKDHMVIDLRSIMG